MAKRFEHRMMTVLAADVETRAVSAIWDGGANTWELTDIPAVLDIRITDQRNVTGSEDICIKVQLKADGTSYSDRLFMRCAAGSATSLNNFWPLLCNGDCAKIIVLGTPEGTILQNDEYIHIDVVYDKL